MNGLHVFLCYLSRSILVAWGLMIALSLPVSLLANADDEGEYAGEETDAERVPATAKDRTSAPLNKARYRLYPGGQDEEDIEVQAVLPTPLRSFDQPSSSGVTTPSSNSSDDRPND